MGMETNKLILKGVVLCMTNRHDDREMKRNRVAL